MLDIEVLSRAARNGDLEAGSSVIRELLPYWLRAAHSIVGENSPRGDLDASDLVQDATLRLIELWKKGEGPESNTRSYVTSIMRNGYVNRLRSPITRERQFDESENGQEFHHRDQYCDIDLAREAEAVRSAFLEVSDDHRLVLSAVVVEGRKPASLVNELGRPAPAVSNLLSRAKHALHRALLLNYLSCGEEVCAENSRKLPSRVRDSFEKHGAKDRGLSHVRTCEGCQTNWRRFASVSTAFGVLPLFAVTQLVKTEASVVAAQAFSATGSPHVEPEGMKQDLSVPEELDAIDVDSQKSAMDPQARVNPTVSRTGASGMQSALQAPFTTTSGTANSFTKILSSKAALVVSSTAVVIGLSVLAVNQISAEADTLLVAGDESDARAIRLSSQDEAQIAYVSLPKNPYGAEFDVGLSIDNRSTLNSLTADFHLAGETEWDMNRLTLSFADGIQILSTPGSLACKVDASSVSCVPDSDSRPEGSFAFTVNDQTTEGGGSFKLELTVEVEEELLIGTASGRW